MKNRKQLLWGGITVAILAVVVFGGWMLSSPRSQTSVPPTIQLSSSDQSKKDYDQGLKALASGDTTAAIAALTEAIRVDPNNTAAKDKLTEIQNARSATPSPSTPTTKTAPVAPAVDPWLTAVKDVASLLPSSYPNFVLGSKTTDNQVTTVVGSPSSSGNPITHIQWTVYDRKTAAGAKKFVDKVSRSIYGKKTSSATINGVVAFFGTDGARLATVAYTRGRYVFEAVVTTADAPSGRKTETVRAAEAFPSTRP